VTGRLRPVRPRSPLVLTPVVLGVWWLVAHNSGSGWVQVLGDAVFGMLVVGIVAPAVSLARATARVTAGPADAIAGAPVELQFTASTRLRVRPVDPPGPVAFVGPAGAVTLEPARRGVHDAVTVDLATAAPFGVQWWGRRVRLALPAPLHVAPQVGAAADLPVAPDGSTGGDRHHVPSVAGEPRGARPYRPGDRRRHVHWRATAHSGELMVRELEEATAEPARVTVSLPADPEVAERVAERALGTVVALLGRGTPVRLITTEANGVVDGPVGDRRDAGRRLARAVGAGGGPAGGQVVVDR
jgi:uncharacterized protein (DUF58 family)